MRAFEVESERAMGDEKRLPAEIEIAVLELVRTVVGDTSWTSGALSGKAVIRRADAAATAYRTMRDAVVEARSGSGDD